ncbi:MAG: hypothetical protein ACI4SA_09595 [Lachnospiraceae bacterium]
MPNGEQISCSGNLQMPNGKQISCSGNLQMPNGERVFLLRPSN